MKKYSVCVQVWHKPEGKKTKRKVGMFYVPCEASNKTEARKRVNGNLSFACFTVSGIGGFSYTTKFANPFNAAYHK